MELDYLKQIKEGCAFLPFYLKGVGMVTKVFYKNGGSGYIYYTVNKIMKDYCNIYLKNYESIIRLCRIATGRKIILPLFVRKDIVFLPLKTTKPSSKGDSSFGYVDINFVDRYMFKDKRILLKNGTIISFLEKGETLKKRFAECNIISEMVAKMNNT